MTAIHGFMGYPGPVILVLIMALILAFAWVATRVVWRAAMALAAELGALLARFRARG